MMMRHYRATEEAAIAAHVEEHGIILIPPADPTDLAIERWALENGNKRRGDGMRRTIDRAMARKRKRRARLVSE